MKALPFPRKKLLIAGGMVLCVAAAFYASRSYYPYSRSLDSDPVQKTFVYDRLGERGSLSISVPRSAITTEFGDIGDPGSRGSVTMTLITETLQPYFPAFVQAVKAIREKDPDISAQKARAQASNNISKITVTVRNRYFTPEHHGKEYYTNIIQDPDCKWQPASGTELIEVLRVSECFHGPRGSKKLFFREADNALYPRIECGFATCTLQLSFRKFEIKVGFDQAKREFWEVYQEKVTTYLEGAADRQ
ncbi:MAG: hypothetical protein AAF441_05470 [Pseudomonadota bacterium]